MWHVKPICLALVALLALGAPARACCATGEGEADGPSGAVTGNSAPPSCHDEFFADSFAPDDEDLPKPCEEKQCSCKPVAMGSCPQGSGELKTPPPSTSRLLEAQRTLAPMQPQTLLPHTFFEYRPGEFDDSARRALSARTLLALSCQLTL